MALIIEPTVAGHVNNIVRPLSDTIVGLIAALRAEQAVYKDVIKPLLTDFVAADEIADGEISIT